jgi:transposase
MEAILTHVAGVDVHKEILAITALIGRADEKPKAEHWTCSTYTQDLEECGKKLLSMGIHHVAMESTGVYWKPIYNVWKPLGLLITVGNATHMKNVPGRKTDVKDSQWIAELHRNGLIRSSFIPEPEFQKLRLMNRHRTNLVEDIARIKNRVQRVLEDGNVKLGSVLSDVFGVAGIAVLDAITCGVTNAEELAARITTRIERKEEVVKSLKNCLCEEHRFVIQQLMLQYLDLKQRLDEIEKELDKHMRPHNNLIERLDKIPGINQITARGIVAEASTNMNAFGEDRRFAAWAGVAPGNNESAQKKSGQEPDMVIQHFDES